MRRTSATAWMLVLVALLGIAAPAAGEARGQTPADPETIPLTSEQEARYRDLIWKLRCLVCQNESVAESNAPLANDLRRIVRQQLAEGRSDREIKQYMRDRYGDFVLYQPPFNATTALLWLAPALLLLIALTLLLRKLRSGYVEPDGDWDEAAEFPDGADDREERP